MKKDGGVKIGADGKFQMSNVTPEMQKILEDIEKAKAAREGAAISSAAGSSTVPIRIGTGPAPPPPGTRVPSTSGIPRVGSQSGSGPPPPPGGGGAPPPPPGPPPDDGYEANYGADATAQMQRLQTENEAQLAARASETMDTLLLIGAKDAEIEQLKESLAAAEAQIAQLSAGTAMPVAPPASAGGGADGAALEEAREKAREAEERAERAEGKLAESNQALTKLTAKLNAVSTLYTEAAQREAVLRIQLEQAGDGNPVSYE